MSDKLLGDNRTCWQGKLDGLQSALDVKQGELDTLSGQLEIANDNLGTCLDDKSKLTSASSHLQEQLGTCNSAKDNLEGMCAESHRQVLAGITRGIEGLLIGVRKLPKSKIQGMLEEDLSAWVNSGMSDFKYDPN